MEQFRNALINQYYRNVNGIMFVYDITNQESFDNIDTWYSEAMKYSEHSDRLKMVLVGNKRDAEEERVVPMEAGFGYAQSRGMAFAEVSAKDLSCMEALDDLLLGLSRDMLADREEHSFTRSMVIKLGEEDWEVVEMPTGDVPSSVYQPQDDGRGLRSQFTSSMRSVASRANNRINRSKCSC